MADVTVRDLRNRGGDILDRVIRGETLIVTRDGRAVAELRSLPRRPLPARVLLERWRRVPPVDPTALRRDVDAVVDPSL